jgi:hypothetical protein
MADYQLVADRVRGFVTGADQTRSDALAELAANFAELCQEANARLRRCLDYLRRGLKSEAIHLAESHPNLLDMVAALDIPEIDEWEQLCAAYELARPARMMIEAAQELNEAYSQEKPLQHLLSKHRVLALRRAPLAERLEVIRCLTTEDPSNSCWAEDQETFETARLRQVRPDVAAAVRSRDLNLIDALATEIFNQNWRIQLPADVKDTLSKASFSLHAEAALGQLRQSARDIDTILQIASLPDAKALLARWDNSIAQYSIQLPPDLNQAYLNARKWVADQEGIAELHAAFKAACADLRAVVDHNVPEELLLERYRAVQAIGIPIPMDLEGAFRERKRSLDRTHKFEKLGLYGLTGVVVLLILATIAFIIWSHFWSSAH